MSVAVGTMTSMGKVILGGEAVRAGVVTRHELRRSYNTLYRGVFIRKNLTVTLRDRAIGAWLATGRKGVIAGVAAAALHGAPWVDPVAPIEVAGVKSLPQEGLIPRTERIAVDEITRIGGLPVTTRLRTAYDLGRHLDRDEALARLDALMWNQRFDVDDVLRLAERHPHARGVTQLRELLPLVDGGAGSPRESLIRLWLIDKGFPRPELRSRCSRGPGRSPSWIWAGNSMESQWSTTAITTESTGSSMSRTSSGCACSKRWAGLSFG